MADAPALARPGHPTTISCRSPRPPPLPVTCQGLALEQQPLLAHGDVQLLGHQMLQRGHQLILRHLARPRAGAGVEPAAPDEGGSPGLPGAAARPPARSPPSARPRTRRGSRAWGRYLEAALTALERLHCQLHGGRGGVHPGQHAPLSPLPRAAALGARRNRPPPPEAARGRARRPGPAPGPPCPRGCWRRSPFGVPLPPRPGTAPGDKPTTAIVQKGPPGAGGPSRARWAPWRAAGGKEGGPEPARPALAAAGVASWSVPSPSLPLWSTKGPSVTSLLPPPSQCGGGKPSELGCRRGARPLLSFSHGSF